MPTGRMTLGAAHGLQLPRLEEHADHRFVAPKAILLNNIETPVGRARDLHLLKSESDRVANSVSEFRKIFRKKAVRRMAIIASCTSVT